MTVAQLRQQCRERIIRPTEAQGGAKALGGADKAVLTQALREGAWPADWMPSAPSASDALRDALLGIMPEPGLDEARVIELIEERQAPSPLLRTQVGSMPEVSGAREHYAFPLLLVCAANRVPAMLVGPAGSGKTHAAFSLSARLGLGIEPTSFGPQTTKSDLWGYWGASGQYVETQLLRAARDGGVFLADELDACSGAVTMALNMVLGSEVFSCPLGTFPRHRDCVIVAGANTHCTGATRHYSARQEQDASSIDRFASIDWGYDEGLESSLAGVPAKSPEVELGEGGCPSPSEWVRWVQSARRAAAATSTRMVISPRATQYGIRLSSAGVGRRWLESMLVWRGMGADVVGKVKGAM